MSKRKPRANEISDKASFLIGGKPILLFCVIAPIVITGLVLVAMKVSSVAKTLKPTLELDKPGVVTGSMMNTTIEQTFSVADDHFYGFSLYFIDYGYQSTCNLKIELYYSEKKTLVQQWEVNAADISMRKFQQFRIEAPLSHTPGLRYTVVINSPDAITENTLTLALYDRQSEVADPVVLNGKTGYSPLMLQILAETNSFIWGYYWLLAVVISILLGVIFFGCFHFQLRLETLFVLAASCLGILYLLVLPPYSSPDEGRHVATAYRLSSVILGEQQNDDDAFVMRRAEDNVLDRFTITPNLRSYELVAAHWNELCGDSTPEEWSKTISDMNLPVQIFPVPGRWQISTLPQAIGVTIAKLFGLGFIPLLILGRLCNLSVYIILCFLALRLIPFGKNALFIIALLPRGLSEAASFSYDAFINGMSFLSIAFILYLAYTSKQVRKRDFIVLGLLMFLLAAGKGLYVFLFIFYLLIPSTSFSSKKCCWYSRVIVSAGMPLLFILFVINSSMGGNLTQQMEVSGNNYTIAYILRNPFDYFALLVSTTIVQFPAYLQSALGQGLGWGNLKFNPMLLWSLTGILVISMMYMPENLINGNKYFNWKEKSIAFVAVFTVYALVLSGMALGGTSTSAKMITLVHGRYLVPLLGGMPILFGARLTQCNRDISFHLQVGVVGISMLIILQLFADTIIR